MQVVARSDLTSLTLASLYQNLHFYVLCDTTLVHTQLKILNNITLAVILVTPTCNILMMIDEALLLVYVTLLLILFSFLNLELFVINIQLEI